ncbi:hypothetical protein AYO49_00925 [Verrucomicrobiaceae bacterium SCGC AG-212-N21]|nr:hypothetical protein AYO49_00925 [Verrucomicrobiaceae bacterium SCGC AG-212-N21]
MAHADRLIEVFNEAKALSAGAERDAFVTTACADDPTLKEQVLSLLEAHEGAGRFLQKTLVFPPEVEAELARVKPERVGDRIGPYKLREQIGEGGFGVVWVAEQEKPVRRTVALKIIKLGMDTRDVVARFEQERQALAMMDHPNIARVFDAGVTDYGRPFFVMELVRGIKITDYCDQANLSTAERLRLFVDVCHAVQHAHQKGIIHRDLKPSNILVTLHDGVPVPKVIDFGVAKATQGRLVEQTIYTQFQQVIGTPLYMSPEQVEMSGLDVDTRADIYVLGVLLYELLTGRTPFDADTLLKAGYDEMRRVIREQEPQKPSTALDTMAQEKLTTVAHHRSSEPPKLIHAIRGDLDWIVMKALEKDRSRRYETANGFANDIQRYLADEPVEACPPSAAYRFRKFARRNRGALAIASAAVLAVLLALVGLMVSNVLITQQKNEKVTALEQAKINEEAANTQRGIAERNAVKAHEQEQIAVANEKRAMESELLARRRYYASQMNLAMQAWEAGQQARVLALLESQRPKIDEDDLRTFEWYYLWRLCQGGLRRRFPAVNFDNSAVLALSPDGLTLASGFGNDVKLWDTLTGQEKKTLTGHTTMVIQLAFTSSGTLISSDYVAIRTWSPATATDQLVPIPGSENGGGCFAVSADGKTLVIDRPTGITLRDLESGQKTLIAGTAGTNPFGIVAADAGVQRVAAFRDDDTIRVWSRNGAAWLEQRSIPTQGWCPSLAFSPDGRMLAVGGTLKCYDPETGQLQRAPSGHTGMVLSVSFCADGKTMVSAGADQTARVWDTATGRQLACFAHPVMVHGAVLSADGKVAATAGNGINVWDAVPQDEAVILPHTGPVLAVAISRDGKSLVSTGWHGTKLWDLAKRSVAASLLGSRTVAISPDGKTLAIRNDKNIELWSVGYERLAVLEGSEEMHKQSLAFSPDGRTLAATFDTQTKLLDLSTHKVKATIALAGKMSSVVFSPDGKTLAAGSQFGVVKLFDASTGRETTTLQRFEFATTWTTALAFSHDSRLLAACNHEGLVQVWETATGRLHATLRGHVGNVPGLSFSPDDRTLATASNDRTVKLWDVATAQERFTLKGHEGPVYAVEFTPDGDTLITGSEDKTVRLWPAAVDSQARARKQELDWDVPGTPAACNERGDGLWQYGHTEEAERAYAEAEARLDQLAAAFPDSVELRQETIRTLLSQSLLLEQTGRPQEAGPRRERAREIYRKLSTNDQQALIWQFCERGRKLSTAGNHRQAERTYSQAIELEPKNALARSRRRGPNIELGAWDKVAVDCSQLVELNPDDAGSWNLRGVAYSRQSEKEKAVADYSQAIRLQPAEPLYWKNRGACYAQTSQYDKAVADFSKALELHPNDAELLNRRGKAYERLGRNEESLADLSRAGELQKKTESVSHEAPGTPQREQEHLKLAEVLRQQKQFAKSETALREAIRLNPTRPTTHETLGLVLTEQKKFAEAETAYREAIRLMPTMADAHYGLGRALHEQKKLHEALGPLREATRLNPASRYAHGRLGSVLLNLGQLPEAELELREMVRLDPEDAEGHFLVGRALSRQNKLPDAIAPLREAVRLQPTHPWAHDELGKAYLAQQRFPEAEAAFREQVLLKPNDYDAHYSLGRALVGQKKEAEAAAPLREAIRLNPKHPGPRGTLGWAYIKLQQYPEAEAEFREQIGLVAPNTSFGLYGLGKALEGQGKHAESMVPLRDLVRLEPTNHAGHEALGWALLLTGETTKAEAEFREVIRLKPAMAMGHWGLGRVLVEQRKYADAEAALREAIRLEPAHSEAPTWLRRALIGQGKPTDAEAALQEKPGQSQSEPGKKKDAE